MQCVGDARGHESNDRSNAEDREWHGTGSMWQHAGPQDAAVAQSEWQTEYEARAAAGLGGDEMDDVCVCDQCARQ